MRLHEQVAIITGSTNGLGRATARRFATEGASVVLVGRDAQRGRQVEREITESGGQARFVKTDITVEEQVKEMVSAAVDTYGKLSVLVNNAARTVQPAGAADAPITEVTNAAWHAIFAVQVNGAFWTCKYAIPEMIRSGGGSIVNISSVSGLLGTPGISAYTTSKSALHGLTRSVAAQYASFNVRCNGIILGYTNTNPVNVGAAQHPTIGPALRRVYPLGFAQPQEIAPTIAFLASSESSFITGALIAVDGGATGCLAFDPDSVAT